MSGVALGWASVARRLLLYPVVPPAIVETVLSLAIQDYLDWQNADGGWPTEPTSDSNPWSTAQAIYLLVDLDHVLYKNKIEDAARWLIDHCNGDHGWGLEPGISDVTGTEQALYALSTWSHHGDQDILKGAAAWLIARQNPDDNGWAFVPRNSPCAASEEVSH